jgi:hypothetical protein
MAGDIDGDRERPAQQILGSSDRTPPTRHESAINPDGSQNPARACDQRFQAAGS